MDLNKNKENAIAFYRTAYLGGPRKAVERYVGNEYIQHNPDVADGPQGFIEHFDQMQKGRSANRRYFHAPRAWAGLWKKRKL